MSNLLNEIIETIDENCELSFSRSTVRDDLRLTVQQRSADHRQIYSLEAIVARNVLFDSKDANHVLSHEIARLRRLVARN